MSQSSEGSSEANYYRVWAGFKRPQESFAQFVDLLPPFMKETVDLYYPTALNQYLVIIPPDYKPSFIPDELALVALSSRDDYQTIRQTPAGQAYSARHWDVFDRATSKSADPIVDVTTGKLNQLTDGAAYILTAGPINWAEGNVHVRLHMRPAKMSAEEFLTELQQYLEVLKGSQDSLGMISLVKSDYFVLYSKWPTQKVNLPIANLGKPLMDLWSQPIQPGQPVRAGAVYKTISSTP